MIWITGASGLLGSQLVASGPPGTIVALRRSRQMPAELRRRACAELAVELSSGDEVEDRAAAFPPSLVIHTAAATDPRWCEAHPERARLDNVAATENLVELCRRRRLPFIHCSTDLVFDGSAAPYAEDDARAPVGVYAVSKAAAEDMAMRWQRSLVVRLPIMLGPSPSGRRSVDEALRLACARGDQVALFEDEFRTPIHARLAAELIWRLAKTGCCGVVHVAGRTRVSRWELGHAIARALGLPRERFVRSSIADFAGAPPRCPDVSMWTDRLERMTGSSAPPLEESLSLLTTLPGFS